MQEALAFLRGRLIGWILNAVYLALLLTVWPVLLYRAVVQGKYRQGWREKLWGDVAARTSERPCVWFHAVSVGEVLQIEPVLDLLRVQRPDVEIVISTTTATGHEVAVKKYPADRVVYFPLDFTWAVNRAMERLRPSLVVLVELEIWPNFLRVASARNVPVALINGRISERSFRGYRRIRFLLAPLLRSLKVIAVQDSTYASRIEHLLDVPGFGFRGSGFGFEESGARGTSGTGSASACHSGLSIATEPSVATGECQSPLPLAEPVSCARRPVVTGSIKFDRIRADRDNARTQELRTAFGLRPGERLLIAGSTQDPEERFAIETWLALRERHPGLRLMLVPRHKERFDQVAHLVEHTFGLPLIRRTSGGQGSSHSAATPSRDNASTPVLLLDTLGELSAAWGLADIAFVGGSLTQRGGQNMLEPAGYGAAVLFGPNTHNFRDIVALLLEADAARVVRTPEELTAAVDALLTDPAAATALGARARDLVLSHRGAAQKTVDLLLPLLPEAACRAAA